MSRTWQCHLGSGDGLFLASLRQLGEDSERVSVMVIVAMLTIDYSAALRVVVTFRKVTSESHLFYKIGEGHGAWKTACAADVREAARVPGAEVFDHRRLGSRSDQAGVATKVRRTTLLPTAPPLPSMPPRALLQGLFEQWTLNEIPHELARRFFRVQRRIPA
jgi:hypothetical protein